MRLRGWTAWLILALAAASCAGDIAGAGANKDPSGVGPGGGQPSAPGNAPGGPSRTGGSGGSTSSGSGGSNAGSGGSMGSGAGPGGSGPPGSSPGGGGGSTSDPGGADAASPGSGDAPTAPPGADAGSTADAAPPSCSIALFFVSPNRANVPAGVGYRMRIGARATGGLVPPKPEWRWQVTFENGQRVAHTPVDGEPAEIYFPTVDEGRYTITAEIVGTACPVARETVAASSPNRLIVEYMVRVKPPAGRPLPVLESDLSVQAANLPPSPTPISKLLEVDDLRIERVSPHEENNAALPAFFIQIASRTSTERFDGYVNTLTAARPWFEAPLPRQHSWSVLIVPDSVVSGPNTRAPIFFPERRAEDFARTEFEVGPGVTLAGRIAGSNGQALAGSRVRLRAGVLPSTLGSADAEGRFSLRVREGRWEARVLPPAGSGLPEAQVPSSAGIEVAAGASAIEPVQFAYNAIATTQLTVNLLKPEGTAPERAVTAVLESLPGELANVGRWTVPGQPAIAADGFVRLTKESSNGVVALGAVPRARYRLILSPPDNIAGEAATTTVALLDLSAAAATVSRQVTLDRKGRIVGRLLPATVANGLTVRAVDLAEDGVRRTAVLAPVDATGRFELRSDPGRAYRIFVEPPPDRRVPRVALEPVRATAATVTLPDQTLPLPLPVVGATVVRGTALPGAVIQIYCRGSAPACVDREAPDITNTLPIDETVSAADGSYRVWIPDPRPRP